MLRQTVPAKELTIIDTTDLKILQILEDVEGDGGVEGKLLVATNKFGLPIGRKF